MRRWRRRARTLLLVVLIVPPLLVAALTLAYRFVQPPLTALQAIRLAQGYGFTRDVQPLEELGPFLPSALIAAEDNRFCRHRGVDWTALGEEIRRWQRGERPRGASTLTMQTTKNLFLWPDRTHGRKALELVLSPLVDMLLPKRRILEIYLNQVELAPGVYGAAAGARHHLGKRASHLGRRDAALLVALLPGPLVWQPTDGRVQRQADRILRRMGQLGPLLDCADGDARRPLG